MAAQPGRADHQQTDVNRRLLEGLQSGNDDVFRELFNSYSRQLYAYSYSLIHDQETAKDHVNEAFASLYVNREKFTSLAHIRNTLYSTIKNLASSHIRNRRNASIKHALAPRDEYQQAVVAEIIQNELISQLYQLLEDLPATQKEIILKWIEEDKSLLEIARELNISVQSAKVNRHRALVFLRTAAIVKKLRSRLFTILF